MMKHLRAAMAFALVLGVAAPAAAATEGETYINDSVQKGLAILGDPALSTDQRRADFGAFLLDVTDMNRTALYTLGKYRAGASEADLAAFATAFQSYAVKVYQSYFDLFGGQRLDVTGSTTRGPGDEVVKTLLRQPGSKDEPLEVDFRVMSDRGQPHILDLNVSGVWLGQEQQDEFNAILAHSGGNIPDLIKHLNEIASRYK